MKAVILAKRSERFPGKHMKMLSGKTVIGMLVEKLIRSGSFDQIIIFTKDPEVWDRDAETVQDNTEGTALASIREAIIRFGDIFVVAGDMPMVGPSFIANMVKRYNGMPLFPIHLDGSLEPLHGIYNVKMVQLMGEYIASGDKGLKKFLEKSTFDTVKIGIEEEPFFTNINYEPDLDRLRAELES